VDRGRGRQEGAGHRNIQERVFIVKLVNDKNDKNRIAGAVGFSVREHKLFVYKAKAILLVPAAA
jgi:adenylylsulfate reductase, subunit A